MILVYAQAHGLSERHKRRARERAAPGQRDLDEFTFERPAVNPRHVLVAEAYNNGETVQGLMELYQVQVNTIIDHLARYIQEGNTLRPDGELLSLISLAPELQSAALAAFGKLGVDA
jgi:hypothetical protein